MTDIVEHPPHYTNHPSGVECITVTEHMNFNLGNAMKYVWRADEKGNAMEDLSKARWYIDREIRRREHLALAEANEGIEGLELPPHVVIKNGAVVTPGHRVPVEDLRM